ncbi:MAG: hypothetical protein WBP28_13465 [Nostocoides sp.]
MPISPLFIQRRHAELGRIRLGEKQEFRRSDGSTGTKPVKLTSFRFTSPQRPLIESVAALYGGDVRAWDNNGKPEWEVVTAATSIPVIVIKGGLSQWMEFWSSGGCIHRCDGERNVLTDAPCDLNEKVKVGRATVNPHIEAKPTTRLSVMLRDVESLGAWRMESHGYNAAAEIPAMAELAMYVGDLVPANLLLSERRVVKDGQTSRFVVPVLDLAISKQRLVELVSAHSGAPALVGGPVAPMYQVEAAAAPVDVDYYRNLAADATTVSEVRGIWQQAKDAGHMGPQLDAELKERAAQVGQENAAQIAPATPAPEPQPEPASSGDSDPESTWLQVVSEAGKRGWETGDIASAFLVFRGSSIEDATAWDLEDFLAALQSGESFADGGAVAQ